MAFHKVRVSRWILILNWGVTAGRLQAIVSQVQRMMEFLTQ